MKALLYVRAVVPDPADRPAFDAWYGEKHSPEGVEKLGFIRFWRYWSHLDASVHYAFYEIEDVAFYDRMIKTPEHAALVADFTATWGDKVTRAGDVLRFVHQFPSI